MSGLEHAHVGAELGDDRGDRDVVERVDVAQGGDLVRLGRKPSVDLLVESGDAALVVEAIVELLSRLLFSDGDQ